jgi:ATP-binding cassette, subfamily B, bacterial
MSASRPLLLWAERLLIAVRMLKQDRVSNVTIADLLRPHVKVLIVGGAAVIGEGIVNLLEPWPLKVVVDNVVKAQPVKNGWLNHLILSVAGIDKLAILKLAAISFLVIACAGAICSYIEKYVTTSVAQWVTHNLRRAVYAHIQKMSLAYHDRKQIGDLLSRVTSDIDAVQSFVISGLMSAVVNSLMLVGMIGVMFYLNWRFTLIALSVAPVLGAVVYTYTRQIKKASRAVRKKEGEIVSVMQEVLSSIRVVKAFAREDYEQQRLEEQSLEGLEIAMKARSLKAKLSPMVEVIVAIGTALVLWFGARMALEGTLSPGALIVFLFYIGKLFKPMQELSKMTDSYSKAAVGFERIREVLDTKSEVKDMPRAKMLRRVKGEIDFDHVSFGYENEAPVLKNVSVTIKPGQLVALVGPSGAGKTTIISLIPRFYDPNSGVVKIDGQDVKRLQQKSLRRHIGFVLQETLLFNTSVWSNIAYGKPGASRNEILRAAEQANADEFIRKLPDGYDTIVGERGVSLSGGQRQRIAIARAIICDTPILILDEPSSGLDAASEKLVFEALDRLMEGKTTVVIAHRLSTIRRADSIFVIDDGRIVENGNHEQLLRAGGLYFKLHELQSEEKDVRTQPL